MASPPRNSQSLKKKVARTATVVPLRAAKHSPKAVSGSEPETQKVEAVLAQMAGRIAGAESVGQAQREQLSLIFDFLRPRVCFIATYDESRNQLQVSTARGRNDGRVSAAIPGEGPLGHAFTSGEVVRDEGVVAAPLSGPEGNLGCLVVVDPKIEASDDLMRALTAQVAAAMEVARLRDQTVRHNKDLQTAVAGLRTLERGRDELLSNVSHDLKNPLTTVKAYVAMLRRAKLGPVSDAQIRALDSCERSSERLLRMINDLVLITRLRAGKMQLDDRPFGLKVLLDELLKPLAPLAERAGLQLVLSPSPEVFVRGDKERLSEALSNLLDHALANGRSGGKVTVAVRSHDSGLAAVEIAGDGLGVTAEEVEHAFEGHYRKRAVRSKHDDSSALSLPVAAKIVQLHGGRIETAPSDGSCVLRVYLPMFAGAVAMKTLAQPPRAGDILIIEDDADCRDVLHQLLEQEGYPVTSAKSGAEGRALLAQARPAMVLLDLRLSDEDGRAILRSIREDEGLSDLPVYIISGASDVGTLSEGTGLDRIDGYFEKPLQLDKLLGTLASVVHRENVVQ